MNVEIKDKIAAKLQKSLADPELKSFFLMQLDSFTEEQAADLLGILDSEEAAVQVEVDRANSEVLKKLMTDMKALSQAWTRKTVVEIEKREAGQNETVLKNLEEDLKSL